MSLSLPNHLRYGLTGSTRLFLNLETGLYFRLAPGEDEIFEALERGAFVNSSSCRPLVDAGILTEAGDGGPLLPTANPPPVASLVEQNGRRPAASLAWIGRTALALVGAHIIVRRPAKLVDRRSSDELSARACSPDRLESLVGTFLAARRFVPIAPNCLRDSIALRHILMQHGIAACLVIGAKLHPFAAHCWVQQDGTVLNDSLAGATGFAPILVVQ